MPFYSATIDDMGYLPPLYAPTLPSFCSSTFKSAMARRPCLPLSVSRIRLPDPHRLLLRICRYNRPAGHLQSRNWTLVCRCLRRSDRIHRNRLEYRDRHPAVENGVATDVRDVDFRYVITTAGINEVAVWSDGCQPHRRSSCREALSLQRTPATAS
jgi:hypothetical protein